MKDINLNPNEKKNNKFMLDYINDKDLAVTDSNCHMNHFIHKHKHLFGSVGEQMKTVYVELGFRYFCDYWKCKKSRRLEQRYSEILAGHFVGKNNYLKEEFLNDIIENYIQKNKILYIVLDFVDYGLDDDIIDKNEYVPHTCTLILIPNNNNYDAFYINSHGKDLLEYDEYNYRISDQKKRTITYDHPVDVMFVDTFVKFLNKNHDVSINYNATEYHNYYGADYQSGDNYGICFIFPYIIWYYFGKYYNTSRTIQSSSGENYEIKSNRSMLLNGELIECVQGFLVDLNVNYKKMYIKLLKSENYNRKYYVNKLDKVLYKSRNYFVNKVLNVFMPFFVQDLE